MCGKALFIIVLVLELAASVAVAVDYIVVDNFDSYTDTTALKSVWNDSTNGAGGTGMVYINKDANFAVDGNSMQFEYWNDGVPYYSETKRTYSTAQDWSYAGAGVTCLEINFIGDVNNAPDPPMYVTLSDGTVTAQIDSPDFNDFLDEWEHTWNIPLKDFSAKGVNLAKISSIILGVGDKVAESGPPVEKGTIYFDDIVADYILVDDFDTYTNTTQLKIVWKDSTPGPGGGIGGCGYICLNMFDPNFASDGNSMQFEYYNNGVPYYSETKRTYSTAQDWSGVTLLDIDWFGDVHNAPDPPMYVKLSDGTKTAQVNCPYLCEVNTPWAEQWQHTWSMPLKGFSDKGVTLSNINSIILGVGDKVADSPPPAEEGIIYFDDIKLFPPRCFPENAIGDLTGDCIIDFKDFAIMASHWLENKLWPLP